MVDSGEWTVHRELTGGPVTDKRIGGGGQVINSGNNVVLHSSPSVELGATPPPLRCVRDEEKLLQRVKERMRYE